MSSESSSKNDASDSSKTQSTTTDTDTEPEKSYYEILNVSTEATQCKKKKTYYFTSFHFISFLYWIINN